MQHVGHRWSVGSVCELRPSPSSSTATPARLARQRRRHLQRPQRPKRWSEIGAVIGRSWDTSSTRSTKSSRLRHRHAASEKPRRIQKTKPEPEEIEEVVAIRTTTRTPKAKRPRRRKPLQRAHGRTRARGRRGLLAQGRDRPNPDDHPRAPSTRSLLSGRRAVSSAATAASACWDPERALARYLADEHDHDLSDLATYEDIKTAATDGSCASTSPTTMCT